MTGAIRYKTGNFQFNVINFNAPTWADEANDNWINLDQQLSFLSTSGSIVGVWENDTTYLVGQRVIDEDTNTLWEISVEHTTDADSTFEAYRALHPTYYAAYVIGPRNRGIWTEGVQYNVNDILENENQTRVGIVLQTHISVTSYATGEADGNISTLFETPGGDLASEDYVDDPFFKPGGIPWAIAHGGTGATSAIAARNNLGLSAAAVTPIGTSGATIPLLSGNNIWSAPQTLSYSDPGAALVAMLHLERASATPAAGDDLIAIQWDGRDSVGNEAVYGRIYTTITDPTDGAEESVMEFQTAQAGASSDRMHLGAGLSVGAPAGGDKGAGTINATGYYLNNVAFGSSVTSPIGTSGAAIPLLNGANTWSAKQIIDMPDGSPEALELKYTNNGGGIGPTLKFNRISTTPAAADRIGSLDFYGRDSLAADLCYLKILALITDPTGAAQDSQFSFQTMQSGVLTTAMHIIQGLVIGAATGGDLGLGSVNAQDVAINGVTVARKDVDNVFTAAQSIHVTAALGATIQETLATAAMGPTLNLYRLSSLPAVSDLCGALVLQGNDAGLAKRDMAQLIARWVAVTAGSATAELVFRTLESGGVATDRMVLRTGLVMGAATGGDKGAGTINAVAVYDDNVLLTCYVFDAVLDGRISVKKWDDKVPDRHIPAEIEETTDAHGKRIVRKKKARVEKRRHEDMRKFKERLGSQYDPLDIDAYAQHWKDKRHLTSMPNENLDPEKGMALGSWVQRLIETVEIQAVHIENLNQRIKALEEAEYKQ